MRENAFSKNKTSAFQCGIQDRLRRRRWKTSTKSAKTPFCLHSSPRVIFHLLSHLDECFVVPRKKKQSDEGKLKIYLFSADLKRKKICTMRKKRAWEKSFVIDIRTERQFEQITIPRISSFERKDRRKCQRIIKMF